MRIAHSQMNEDVKSTMRIVSELLDSIGNSFGNLNFTHSIEIQFNMHWIFYGR